MLTFQVAVPGNAIAKVRRALRGPEREVVRDDPPRRPAARWPNGLEPEAEQALIHAIRAVATPMPAPTAIEAGRERVMRAVRAKRMDRARRSPPPGIVLQLI